MKLTKLATVLAMQNGFISPFKPRSLGPRLHYMCGTTNFDCCDWVVFDEVYKGMPRSQGSPTGRVSCSQPQHQELPRG